MHKFYFILLHLFFLINRGLSQSSSLILKFETNYPTKLNPDNYFESKYINEPKINLKIGTHRQSIPCYLNINTQTLYISGSNSDLIETQPKYEEFKSSKFKNISNKITSESFYVYGIPSKDEICLNNDIITQLKFYLAKTKFSEKELSYSCVLGLGYEEMLYNDDGEMKGIESFITQMKNNNIIADKIFFIGYNNENNNDNGEVFFGAYPHEIKNKYYNSCNENDYIEMEYAANEIEVIWSVKGYVYVGEDKIFNYLSPIMFELNQGFIIGSYNYKFKIEKNFFNEKISNNECYKREIYIQKNFYDGYYCKKNVDVTKFENLTIIIDKISYTIEFVYKDLFTENDDDYLYFNVLFTQEEDTLKNSFILGKPFFKKYPVVFNVNRKKEKIGFYNNLFIKEENENQIINNNENNSNYYNKLTYILIIIGICILGLLIYIIIKYFKRPRKQKVNELIEFFDYSSVQQKI